MVQNEINLLQSLNKVARELIENDFCNNKKIYHLLNYKTFLKKGEKNVIFNFDRFDIGSS